MTEEQAGRLLRMFRWKATRLVRVHKLGDAAIDDLVQAGLVRAVLAWPRIVERDDPLQYCFKVGQNAIRREARRWFKSWNDRHVSTETELQPGAQGSDGNESDGPATIGDMLRAPGPTPLELLLQKERDAEPVAQLARMVEAVTPERDRAARLRLGWRLKDLAERSHSSAQVVGNFERGKTVDTLVLRVQLLGVLTGAWDGLLPGWNPRLAQLAREAGERVRDAGPTERQVCQRGLHSLTEENVLVRSGGRLCRACYEDWTERSRARLCENARRTRVKNRDRINARRREKSKASR